MRSALFACLALAPSVSLADVPVPLPRPPVAEELPPPVVVAPPQNVASGCPQGHGTPAQMWEMVGRLTADERVYSTGAVFTGKLAGEMLLALHAVTGEPTNGATAIVVFAWNDGDQSWLTMSAKCAPAIVLLKPAQIKAIAAVMRVEA